MTWTDPRSELRRLLNDGPTDKLRYRKQVFGLQDGNNKTLKTFEDRRLSNFATGSTGGIGVFINQVGPATVTSDDPDKGQFTLQTAPENNDTVEASYYVQWFIDDELDDFLNAAADWLGFQDRFQVTQGLRNAAKKFAAAEAYQKLATRFSEYYSQMYKSQEIDVENSPVTGYLQLSTAFRKDATNTRDEFYKRQGRSLQPLWGTIVGKVTTPKPNR